MKTLNHEDLNQVSGGFSLRGVLRVVAAVATGGASEVANAGTSVARSQDGVKKIAAGFLIGGTALHSPAAVTTGATIATILAAGKILR